MKRISVTVVNITGKEPFYVQWRDHKGNKVRRSTGTSKKREAQDFARKLEETLNQSHRPDDGTMLLETLMLDWCEEVGPQRAKKSIYKVTGAVAHAQRILKTQCLNDLNAQSLSRLVATLHQDHELAGVKSIMSGLRLLIRWAHKTNRMPHLPHFPTFSISDDDAAGGEPMTDEQFARLLQAVPKVLPSVQVQGYLDLLHGLWYSGMRLGEAISVRWDDAPMCIKWSGDKPTLRIRPKTDKSKRGRECPLTRDFAEFLQTIRKDSGLVFPIVKLKRRGAADAITTDHVGKTISKICEHEFQGEVYVPTAHDIRRSFGCRWALKVPQPKILQELMRHASIETTMKYYARIKALTIQEQIWNM